MLLVTGATGTVGREVLRRLPEPTAASPVRVMAREPGRVTGAPESAEIVHGDFTDARSLAEALRGVHRVLLLSVPSAEGDAVFLREAGAAGVRHVVKLSAAAVADEGADDLITRWQRRNEQLLVDSGLAWTLLRPRAFMSNTLSWARSIRTDDTVRALYGTSLNACVDPRDVAEAAVRVLTGAEHEGRAYPLTGPEALSAVDQTRQLAQLLRRSLQFEELDADQARTALTARYSPEIAGALVESAERGRAGSKSEVDGTAPALLGRPAGDFRTWAADHLDAFRAG
ncbi:nucleotide-diphosphate-sugar epimerase [Streptomyces spiroverticillatus]|uniref:Nucleotide-diphosphate-sugar epimerase n=1 Tax=Streptomyces finlayi TaxID=67296 RepID=A0A918X523_9ACTN|nr:NAD(P)H-binding protein [Streptomyces finlayi]GHA35600.1 nucleotide-diphosphate-sugar epimerase [Streptomyces spiroverticillatus]GHD12738.1 nucleotide-diphosphate-sugar epimerase [Streptomyces finlayi]